MARRWRPSDKRAVAGYGGICDAVARFAFHIPPEPATLTRPLLGRSITHCAATTSAWRPVKAVGPHVLAASSSSRERADCFGGRQAACDRALPVSQNDNLTWFLGVR